MSRTEGDVISGGHVSELSIDGLLKANVIKSYGLGYRVTEGLMLITGDHGTEALITRIFGNNERVVFDSEMGETWEARVLPEPPTKG